MLGIHSIHQLFNLVFVGKTLRRDRYHESSSLPSQSLGLTYKQTKPNDTEKFTIQYNSIKRKQRDNKHKLILIWSYSYDPRVGKRGDPLSGTCSPGKPLPRVLLLQRCTTWHRQKGQLCSAVNRRSGFTLAMSHRFRGIFTNGLNGL